MNNDGKPRYAFIECVRGYAVLLVVVCHASYSFPQLPYPIHRMAVTGWYGVQLFFLASAVTLAMSWRHEIARNGTTDIGGFFLRRLFRIAPAYYAAALMYAFITPPKGGFDLPQAAASFLFVNAWHPVLMPTVTDGWYVVPGGWSIGVEFSFYAVFPLIIGIATTLQRAVWLLTASLLVGAACNTGLWPILQGTYGEQAASNFLYFWFPNQMCVFALGICLFFLLQRDRGSKSIPGRHSNSVAALALAAVPASGYLQGPHFLDFRNPIPPAFLVVSVALMIFVLALARARSGIWINRPIALLGRVSFSVYLVHFAILHLLDSSASLQSVFNLTGWLAIGAFGLELLAVVPLALAASWCTYTLIEEPMIGVGRTLIRYRRRVAAGSVH